MARTSALRAVPEIEPKQAVGNNRSRPHAGHPHLTGEDRQQAIRDAMRCKALRFHQMEPVPPPAERRPSFGTLVAYRCERCGTIRYDVVNRNTGELYYRTYDPPSWYKEANEDRHDNGWWRSTWWDSLDASLLLDAAPTPIKPKRGRKRA